MSRRSERRRNRQEKKESRHRRRMERRAQRQEFKLAKQEKRNEKRRDRQSVRKDRIEGRVRKKQIKADVQHDMIAHGMNPYESEGLKWQGILGGVGSALSGAASLTGAAMGVPNFGGNGQPPLEAYNNENGNPSPIQDSESEGSSTGGAIPMLAIGGGLFLLGKIAKIF